MKNLVLFFVLFFFSFALNAQDSACQKRTHLQSMQKINKKWKRMVIKPSNTGPSNRSVMTTTIMERDTLSNTRIYTSININSTVPGRQRTMETERISFNKKFYSRKNNEAWQLVPNKLDNQSSKDSLRLEHSLQAKRSRIEDKCQQLADEMLDGEKCFVFIIESERPRLKSIKETSKEKASTSDCIKSIRKEWYSEQGLLRKIEAKTNYTPEMEDTSITTYEYDIDIPLIKEPVIKN